MRSRTSFLRIVLCLSAIASGASLRGAQQAPAIAPPGTLVDIGGQRLHVHCTGTGSPTVLLENGAGDFSVIWALVQPAVAKTTRVCSYDRGGFAWSEPGQRPRTFAQLGLELRTALRALNVPPPFVLVGQSFGGLVVRGFARDYSSEVAGMVLVDAVHEDGQVVYGGQPHRIRDSATGRTFVAPRIALDRALIDQAAARPPSAASNAALSALIQKLPDSARRVWRWASAQPMAGLAQDNEMEWSPEELARFHEQRATKRDTLGDIPLVVLARTSGGYADGMKVSAADLETERRALQADLATLSSRGRLAYAKNAGHNLHVEDPQFVIDAIVEVVGAVRKR